ncbi:hypothetical protein K435DRAFT_779999 [Dendrothele bispora CBS 962.96]|uniref:Phosphatidate phosphatase APP1 catalytic domain-containing protein n=1 Tax=Dendrothele bispora (strain CBS 962.96) TaxID=1314807 RepID=A0A4S8LTS2_DENBC|nr:hypothetical protein K435DRAFT_779999 [Dendrothele bispora CBS 962.96]
MSEGLSKWRSAATTAATSRFSSLKNTLPQAISRQLGPAKPGSWREWAGQKITGTGPNTPGTERIALFPGWAARNYRSTKDRNAADPFEVHVYVSGFATVHRAPEFVSRSQRAFMRLARGYAALPKLDGGGPQQLELEDENEVLMSQLTPSTEDLLQSVKLPPRPTEDTEAYEVEALERHFRRMNAMSESPQPSPQSSNVNLPQERAPPRTPINRRNTQDSIRNPINPVTEELRKLHANLEARLQPFWSSVLPNRTIRINIFASYKSHDASLSSADSDQIAIANGAILTQDVTTAADGSFQARFRINWEEMCTHESFVQIAFGDPSEEHDLLVTAQVIPPSPSHSAHSSASSSTSDLRDYVEQWTSTPDPPPPVTMHISLTHTPLRVISDVDDTVKLSNISSGARAVFHNVFVKELSDLVIPGMGEWYSDIWRKGARFHYVSNGPFELLPVIGEFFKIAKLPPGSIKLRSYAGKSLFSGLLSAPLVRKRAGVLDIIDAFPATKFILVGDSGEQDLELYAELAREKPSQILAVFIRDTLIGLTDALDDPTGRFNLDHLEPTDLPPPPLQLPPPPRFKRAPTDPDRTLAPINTSYAVRTPGTPRKSSLSTGYFSSNITSEPEAIAPMNANTTPTAGPYSAVTYGGYGKKRSWGSKGSLSLSTASSGPSNGPVSAMPVMSNTPYSASPSLASSSSTSSNNFNRPKKKSSSMGSSIYSGMSAGSGAGNVNKMPDLERKRYELQMRVWTARNIMPEGVFLRVFRDAEECGQEMRVLMSRVGLGGKG